jgi:hypothetical protein
MTNVDPRAPDVTHAQASIMPFVIMLVIVVGLAVGAYFNWPLLQQVLDSGSPNAQSQRAH